MSLLATLITNTYANANLDNWENRASRYGALDAFLAMSNSPMSLISPELREKALQAIGTKLQIPVLNNDPNITIGNKRSITITPYENTSAMVQVTFMTLSWGLTMVPSQYRINQIGYERDFAQKYFAFINKAAALLDTNAIAKLEANKSKVFNNPLDYPTTGDQINASGLQGATLLGDLNSIHEADDFYSQIHVIGNTGVRSLTKQLSQLGMSNAINKQLEYDDKVFHFSNRVVNEAENSATMFSVQDGSIGLLTQIEPDCLTGTVLPDGHVWGSQFIPELGMTVGTYYYPGISDESSVFGKAVEGFERTVVDHFGFAVNVAFITAYNSDPNTKASPIAKAVIAKGSNPTAIQVVVANNESNPVHTKDAAIV